MRFSRVLRRHQRGNPACAGAVLMEVVLALTLFVAAASILSSALSASVDSVERQKKQLHASNLALSVLAELKLGARSLDAAQPAAFEPPYEQWTAEIIANPAEAGLAESSSLMQVEVVVRDRTASVAARFGQIMDASASDRAFPTSEAP